MNLDTRIFYVINGFARNTPWLQPVVAGYANNGILVFAALMIAGWWVARKSSGPAAMAAALWTPLGVLAALVVYDPIALAVNETRPCNALHDIVQLRVRIQRCLGKSPDGPITRTGKISNNAYIELLCTKSTTFIGGSDGIQGKLRQRSSRTR